MASPLLGVLVLIVISIYTSDGASSKHGRLQHSHQILLESTLKHLLDDHSSKRLKILRLQHKTKDVGSLKGALATASNSMKPKNIQVNIESSLIESLLKKLGKKPKTFKRTHHPKVRKIWKQLHEEKLLSAKGSRKHSITVPVNVNLNINGDHAAGSYDSNSEHRSFDFDMNGPNEDVFHSVPSNELSSGSSVSHGAYYSPDTHEAHHDFHQAETSSMYPSHSDAVPLSTVQTSPHHFASPLNSFHQAMVPMHPQSFAAPVHGVHGGVASPISPAIFHQPVVGLPAGAHSRFASIPQQHSMGISHETQNNIPLMLHQAPAQMANYYHNYDGETAYVPVEQSFHGNPPMVGFGYTDDMDDEDDEDGDTHSHIMTGHVAEDSPEDDRYIPVMKLEHQVDDDDGEEEEAEMKDHIPGLIRTRHGQIGKERVQVGIQHGRIGKQRSQIGKQQDQIGIGHGLISAQNTQTGKQRSKIGNEHITISRKHIGIADVVSKKPHKVKRYHRPKHDVKLPTSLSSESNAAQRSGVANDGRIHMSETDFNTLLGHANSGNVKGTTQATVNGEFSTDLDGAIHQGDAALYTLLHNKGAVSPLEPAVQRNIQLMHPNEERYADNRDLKHIHENELPNEESHSEDLPYNAAENNLSHGGATSDSWSDTTQSWPSEHNGLEGHPETDVQFDGLEQNINTFKDANSKPPPIDIAKPPPLVLGQPPPLESKKPPPIVVGQAGQMLHMRMPIG